MPTKGQSPIKTTLAFTLAPPLRDAGRIQSFSIPKQTGEIAVRLLLESADYPFYRVALVNQSDDKRLWASGKIKTNSKGENKALNIRFSPNLLKSQIYSLVVSGIDADGEVEIISDYPFRAVIK